MECSADWEGSSCNFLTSIFEIPLIFSLHFERSQKFTLLLSAILYFKR